MKSPLIVALLALVFSSVALVTMLVSPRSSEPREVAPVLPAAAGPDADLLARVEILSEENRELRDRLAMLENSPTPVQRAPVTEGFASREELDALRDEMREALARRGVLVGEAPSAATPEFREQVADTLSQIRHEEAVGNVRARQERRLARLDETMPKIESWLELTPQQSNAMRSALLTQYDREAELVRRWGEGEDPEVLGEVKVSDREAHLNDLSAILTPAQLETYTSRGQDGGK